VAGFDLLEAAAGNAENPPRRHTHFAYLRLKPLERAEALQDRSRIVCLLSFVKSASTGAGLSARIRERLTIVHAGKGLAF
jgi:hypothetical protein